MKSIKIIILLVCLPILVIALLPNLTYASFLHPVDTLVSSYCAQFAPSALSSAASSLYLLQTVGYNFVILITLLLILVIAGFIAILYAAGYIFNLDNLKATARSEFGELLLTGVLIAIFFGASVAFIGFLGNPYQYDCTQIGYSAVLPFWNFLSLSINNIGFSGATSFYGSFTLTYGVGIGFNYPWQGLFFLSTIITFATDASYLFIGLLLGTLIALTIFYNLLPIFLYVGIVLRTIPWSRPAGGALIAVYIAFFIVFPLLLQVMLQYGVAINQISISSYNQYLCVSLSKGSSCIFNLYDAASHPITTAENALSAFATNIFPTPALIQQMVEYAIAPYVYAIFAVVLSFYVSYEFLEVLAGYIGSPSLSSSGMLRRLV